MASLNGITAKTCRRRSPHGGSVYRTELFVSGKGWKPVKIAEWRQDDGKKSGILFVEEGFSEEKVRDAVCSFGTGFFSDNIYMLSCYAEYERMWKLGTDDGYPALAVAEAAADYIGRYLKADEMNGDISDVMADERHELELKYPREEITMRVFTGPADFALGSRFYAEEDLAEDGTAAGPAKEGGAARG